MDVPKIFGDNNVTNDEYGCSRPSALQDLLKKIDFARNSQAMAQFDMSQFRWANLAQTQARSKFSCGFVKALRLIRAQNFPAARARICHRFYTGWVHHTS